MAERGDGDLAVFARLLRQADDLVDDLRRAEATADVGEPDAVPVGLWKGTNRCNDFPRASARGEEGNSFPVDLGQVRLAGEAVVEGQLARQAAGFLKLVRVESVEAAGELTVWRALPDAFRRPGT